MDCTTTLDDLMTGLQGELVAPPGLGGREAIPFEAEIVRELLKEDLDTPPDPSQSVPVHTKSLRTRHHELAKALASGRKHVEVAALTGYSQSRISILLTDPAFCDLVEHYKEEVNEIFRENHERLADLAKESLEVLLERLDENPDGFTPNQLLEMAKVGSDRTGDGPTSTQKVEGTILHATPDRIAHIKNKVREKQNGQAKQISQSNAIEGEVIEVEASDEGPGQETYAQPSEDSGIRMRRADGQSAAEVCGEAEIKRFPSKGEDVRKESGEEASEED